MHIDSIRCSSLYEICEGSHSSLVLCQMRSLIRKSVKVITHEKMVHTQRFLAPTTADERRPIARRFSTNYSIEDETRFGYSFERSWMIISIATGIPCILDHWAKDVSRELVIIERSEANDIITFAYVNIKSIE